MATLDAHDQMIRDFRRRRDLYVGRNQAMQQMYRLYFQFDENQEKGFDTIATSDARTALDMAVYVLSANQHRDSLPWNVQNALEEQRKNKGEYFLHGLWRLLDRREMLRGAAWHQRRLATWLLLTGWYTMFYAILPDSQGYPKPYADLWDPAGVYPAWEGQDGVLSQVDHEYALSLGQLRIMADLHGYSGPELDGEDSLLVVVLDHWESRYNRLRPEQPDILNAVLFSPSSVSDRGAQFVPLGQDAGGWETLRPLSNRTGERDGGFVEIPVLVGAAGGVEMSSAYVTDMAERMRNQGQGFLAAMREEQLRVNTWLSTLQTEIKAVMQDNSTVQYETEGGTDTIAPSEHGGVLSTFRGDRISRPLDRQPQIGATSVMLQALEQRIQRATFPYTFFGQTQFSLSGVALDQLHQGIRAGVDPYRSAMAHIYSTVGFGFIRDYRRRWHGKRRYGRVKLSGFMNRAGLESGYFDQEFTPDDVPETHWVDSVIDLSLVDDMMMRANVARALNPDLRISPDYIREHVLHIPDNALEKRLAAAGAVEASPVYQNIEVAMRLLDEALAERAQGGELNVLRADMKVFALRQLLQSLLPQGGRGIPEGFSPGPPEAGGVLGNQGGGRPELSLQNQRQLPPGVEAPGIEAPGGGGTLAQAQRNV